MRIVKIIKIHKVANTKERVIGGKDESCWSSNTTDHHHHH